MASAPRGDTRRDGDNKVAQTQTLLNEEGSGANSDAFLFSFFLKLGETVGESCFSTLGSRIDVWNAARGCRIAETSVEADLRRRLGGVGIERHLDDHVITWTSHLVQLLCAGCGDGSSGAAWRRVLRLAESLASVSRCQTEANQVFFLGPGRNGAVGSKWPLEPIPSRSPIEAKQPPVRCACSCLRGSSQPQGHLQRHKFRDSMHS